MCSFLFFDNLIPNLTLSFSSPDVDLLNKQILRNCLLDRILRTLVYMNNFFLLKCVVLRSLLGADVGPNKVIEIKTDTLGNLPVLHRDEGMVLHGPAVGQFENRKIQYEIVLNRPCSDNLNTAFR